MTAPALTIDPAVVDEIRRGEEPGLERLFRSTYQGLLNEAKAQLGTESSAASRVVERAFARVWSDRSTFTTPDTLERYLHAAVHDASVRERSRLGALHRFEANERVSGAQPHQTAEPTVDEAWAHVAQVIHSGSAGARAREQVRGQASHEAAVHMASIGKKRSWLIPVGGVVLTGAIVFGLVTWLSKGSANAALTNALASSEAKTVTPGTAQIGMINVDEFNKVKLAPESRLRIPVKFSSTAHGIKVEGTAQVTAAKGQALPLEIRVGPATVLTPGGVVDMASDSVKKTLVLRQREGSSTVRVGRETRELAAGTALAVDANGAFSTPDQTAIDESLGWTDGRVTISNRTLKEMLPLVKRWWGLELYLKDTAVMNRPTTVSASLESPREAIASLEKSAGVAFGYEGKTMVLHDAPKGAQAGGAKKK